MNERKSLLVVDDSLEIRMLVGKVLERAGYAVHLAANGAEAQDLLHREGFDLVICDFDMPVMNGYETARLIHSNPMTRKIPILMLTSHDLPDDDSEARQAGVNAWMMKQFTPQRLIETVERLTAKRVAAGFSSQGDDGLED